MDPITAAMLGLKVGGSLWGAVEGNQTSQRNKGYIQASYLAAQKKLGLQQRATRDDTAGSLTSRGLTVSGNPIYSAMAGAAAPHTLGEQVQSDQEKQFTMENTSLDQQRDKALQTNSADRLNSYIGSGVGAIEGAMSAYGSGQEAKAAVGDTPGTPNADALGAVEKLPAASYGGASYNSPIASAMSGAEHPSNWFGGIPGSDPLNAPGSSWNRSTNVAQGQSNAQFNVGAQ